LDTNEYSNMGRLEGKVALVTGAGSGFGEGISKAYAREGAKIIIADISVDGGKRVESEINGQAAGSAVFIEMNCTKEEAWKRSLDLAKEKFGKLDIVVNNAGTTYKKKASVEVTEEEFDKIVAVNMKSIYMSVVVIMPYFVERKAGVYLNTSSVAGTRVRPGQVFYGGTKGFVNTVSLICVSIERANSGILGHAGAGRRVRSFGSPYQFDMPAPRCDWIARIVLWDRRYAGRAGAIRADCAVEEDVNAG